MRKLFAAGLLAGLSLSTAAYAADASGPFAGSWTIASAKLAPWADAQSATDTKERDSLVGTPVTFEAKRIVARGEVACNDLRYAIKTYTPDMLFQGSFTDPAKQAPQFGFKGNAITTLETGCANEIDFHLADSNTAEFALNDYIYMLKRAGAPK